MANDVTNKTAPSSISGTGDVGNQPENSNTSVSNATSAADQQKVPPLRIVLNTSSNQKSSPSINEQPAVTKKEKHNHPHDANSRTDGALKSRVRIKLGANTKSPANCSTKEKTSSEQATTNKGTTTSKSNDDNLNDDTSSSSFTHLRRITRRSQRTIQTFSNEDDESISSMTSIDENLQNSTNPDSSVQDSEQSNLAPTATTSNASTNNSATNGSNLNSETPRRYKRRKGEPSESQSFEGDTNFGSQNYKLPDQNSIELFKNIRKQVDKRLRNLNSIQPKAPYGFRDYMLSRGAYLLDGNKLGNGTSLLMNEDGGLNAPPAGKYHAIRQNRINYTVPNRAKVPSSLSTNSPLHQLFIDQEKERHRMRMQHIKEREKLTIAAEQEIVRVYNQAALIASNQTEPFSACTMLKHQEIYDYLNSEGKIILSRENAQHDQSKPDSVRPRRRPHGDASPNYGAPDSQSRKNSYTDEVATPATQAVVQAEQMSSRDETTATNSTNTDNPDDSSRPKENEMEALSSSSEDADKRATNDGDQADAQVKTESGSDRTDAKDGIHDEVEKNKNDDKSATKNTPEYDKSPCDNRESSVKKSPALVSGESDERLSNCDDESYNKKDKIDAVIKDEPMKIAETIAKNERATEQESSADNANESTKPEAVACAEETKNSPNSDDLRAALDAGASCEASYHNSEESQQEASQVKQRQCSSDVDSTMSPSEEDRQAHNRELFLAQLQEVDDKWDKIRKEMLVRHKNEAESLHAIQKLEWEWKTKEIGACDVRATPVIENTLVPKLNIYSQDY